MKFVVAAAGVAVALSAAAVQTMDLEWNVRYDTTVPYEVELSPAKLEKLAGVPKRSGFVVRADGRDLDAVAFTGKEPGTIDLRFQVPPGAKRLTCDAGVGALQLIDSSQIDNLFAGALDAKELDGSGWSLVTSGWWVKLQKERMRKQRKEW